MTTYCLSILFVVFLFNSAFANAAFRFEESVEDIERSQAQWNKIRTEVIKSSKLSHSEVEFLESIRHDNSVFIEWALKDLIKNPSDGNLKASLIEIERGDQKYLNYLKFNLPKDLYLELVSKRTAFKLSGGERLEFVLRNDPSI